MRWFRLCTLGAVALGCSGHEALLKRPQRIQSVAVDVESQNLRPQEELEGLLRGVQGFGRTVDALRIAVPPLDDSRLGEGYAAVIIAELTTTPGVTVLERSEIGRVLDELKRRGDDRSIIAAGKLLGAQAMILGSIIDDHKLSLRLVRVETGEIMEADVIALPRDGWESPVRAQVDVLMGRLGLRPGSDLGALPPLTGQRLELASRARALQYSGKLLEAQPLYAKALAEPTSAWRFEADYMQVMSDLGLYEWSRDRAEKVLGRIAVNESTMCDRTRIFIQKNRKTLKVAEVREAVRMAASCGDRELLAQSLFYYGLAFENIDFARAHVAMQKAHDLLADGKSPYTRCPIDYILYREDEFNGANPQGSREDHYVKLAGECAAAGNMRFASMAMGDAADDAWQPERKVELLDKAVEYGKVAGGAQLDNALRASAGALRDLGRPSQADARLLSMIGTRLRAITAIYGALPDDEQKLDDDLLSRAGVTRPAGAPRMPSASDALIARVHRKALAGALRAWADRTRPNTKKQADFYSSIANALDPPDPVVDDRGKLVEQQATLSLASIAAASDAPPYKQDPDLWDAFWTVQGWFGALDGASHDRPTVLAAMKKLAAWNGAPHLLWWAAHTEASAQIASGDLDGAAATLRIADRYSHDDVSKTYYMLGDEADLESKRKDYAKLVETREKQVELAHKLGASLWVSSVAASEWAKFMKDPSGPGEGMQRLVEVAQELEAKQSWELAALALEKAANHINLATHADGSAEALELYVQRIEVLENLGDPLRSIEARADALGALDDYFAQIYRGGKWQAMRTSLEAKAMVSAISDHADELVRDGRHRDAVRLVVRLPPAAPGVEALIVRGLGWADAFKDSAEYEHLVALLHANRGIELGGDARLQEYAAARDHYVADGDYTQAVGQQHNILLNAPDEDAMWHAYDKCVELAAKAQPSDRLDCVRGVPEWIKDHSRTALVKRDELAKLMDTAKALTPTAVDRFAPQWRMYWYEDLAVISGRLGDAAASEQYIGEIRTYYTATSPDLYQWASALSRLADALDVVDPKRALALAHQFVEAHAVSSYWIVTQMPRFAEIARHAGDKKSEQEFLKVGREQLAENPRYSYRYDIYRAGKAYEAKHYADAARAYGDAAASLRKTAPGEQRDIDNQTLWSALSHAKGGDLATAKAELKPFVDAAKQGSAETPCLFEQVLEVSIAIENARGQCAAAAELRTLAETQRAQCTERKCRDSEVDFCDGPGDLTLHAENACKKPFAISGD